MRSLELFQVGGLEKDGAPIASSLSLPPSRLSWLAITGAVDICVLASMLPSGVSFWADALPDAEGADTWHGGLKNQNKCMFVD